MIKRLILILLAYILTLTPPVFAEGWLKYNTSATIRIGPFVDEIDGVTPQTGVDSAGSDLSNMQQAYIIDSDGTEIDISTRTFTNCANSDGFYNLSLLATDVDEFGDATLLIQHSSVCLPVWKDFKVVHGNVYDSLFSTDKLQVDTVEVGGTTQTALDINDILDDTNELQGDDIPGAISGLNNISTAEVNTEVDNALDTAIPGSPTTDSINERIQTMDDSHFHTNY